MTFLVNELVIAGWTGRDEAALQKHIRELEEIGVKPPKTTPIFYRVAASLFTHAQEIQVSGPDTSRSLSVFNRTNSTSPLVSGPETSGEVEFVLLKTDKDLLVSGPETWISCACVKSDAATR